MASFITMIASIILSELFFSLAGGNNRNNEQSGSSSWNAWILSHQRIIVALSR